MRLRPAVRYRTEPLFTIHSGGQTGVDRAALDAALSLGVPVGGWCPQGRRSEDGPIASHYLLRETPSTYYVERTRWNVRDADATLILTRGTPTGGTTTTAKAARALDKPLCIVDLAETDDMDPVVEWLRAYEVRMLNIAGAGEHDSRYLLRGTSLHRAPAPRCGEPLAVVGLLSGEDELDRQDEPHFDRLATLKPWLER